MPGTVGGTQRLSVRTVVAAIVAGSDLSLQPTPGTDIDGLSSEPSSSTPHSAMRE